jgi:mannose-6-phosphate isomerase-like protein (cupin superfamily)
METTVINFKEKFGLFSERWSPKVIAQMNDYHFKIAKIQGDFVWHSHPETDETFIVVHGKMMIEFRDGVINLEAGEMCIIPKGVDHKPFADEECHIMMVELAGTVNTGDAGGEMTVKGVEWI